MGQTHMMQRPKQKCHLHQTSITPSTIYRFKYAMVSATYYVTYMKIGWFLVELLMFSFWLGRCIMWGFAPMNSSKENFWRGVGLS
jgi:hypothetical protein